MSLHVIDMIVIVYIQCINCPRLGGWVEEVWIWMNHLFARVFFSDDILILDHKKPPWTTYSTWTTTQVPQYKYGYMYVNDNNITVRTFKQYLTLCEMVLGWVLLPGINKIIVKYVINIHLDFPSCNAVTWLYFSCSKWNVREIDQRSKTKQLGQPSHSISMRVIAHVSI